MYMSVGFNPFTRKKTKKDSYKEIDSQQWRKEHYVVNRDSAYADPRITITKLIVVTGSCRIWLQ
jgi:carbonic anhydrase